MWRRSVAILVSCAGAMTVTPLGVHFWTEIPRSLSRINQYTLDEWARPGLTELPLLPFWGIAAVYLVTLVRKLPRVRQAGPVEAMLHVCALALLPGALSAVRNVGPFLMIAVPALTHVWALPPEPSGAVRAPERRAVNLAVLAIAACSVVLVLSGAYRDQWDRLKWNPVPPAAIGALERCPGNLYNRYDEGGMLIWFAPQRKVFLDGRQDPFPPALVLEHIEMETGVRDYEETFARHDIGCAFLPVHSPVASRLTNSDWTPLFRDSKWIVLRKS
jgi:hypothetical protein